MSNRLDDRPASKPCGMRCVRCDASFVGADWHDFCATCVKIIDGDLPESVRPVALGG